jgi:hypothetical protein
MPSIAMEEVPIWTTRGMRQEQERHAGQCIRAVVAPLIHLCPCFTWVDHVDLDVAVGIPERAFRRQRCRQTVQCRFRNVVLSEARRVRPPGSGGEEDCSHSPAPEHQRQGAFRSQPGSQQIHRDHLLEESHGFLCQRPFATSVLRHGRAVNDPPQRPTGALNGLCSASHPLLRGHVRRKCETFASGAQIAGLLYRLPKLEFPPTRQKDSGAGRGQRYGQSASKAGASTGHPEALPLQRLPSRLGKSEPVFLPGTRVRVLNHGTGQRCASRISRSTTSAERSRRTPFISITSTSSNWTGPRACGRP